VLDAELDPLRRQMIVVYEHTRSGHRVVRRRYPDVIDPPAANRVVHLLFLGYGHYQCFVVP